MRTRETIEADRITACIDIGDAYGQSEHNNLLTLEVLLDIREGLAESLPIVISKLNSILGKL